MTHKRKFMRRIAIGGGGLGFIKIRHCEILRITRRIMAIHSFYRHCEILRSRIVAIHFAILTILSNLHSIELSELCKNNLNNCKIDSIYSKVTHHGTLALSSYIQLSTNGGIDTFTNYGTITNTGNTRAFYWSNGYMRHLINYGEMGGIGGNRGGEGQNVPMSVTNYGVMGAIDTGWGSADITINNLGFIGMASNDGKTRHLAGGSYSFIIQNYTLMMTQSATTFNAFSGSAVDNSQVVLDGGSMRFSDDNAKVFLDFGGDFSFGEAYLLDKLFVDMSGKNALSVDFSRLTVHSDIYYLTQSENSFIVHLAPQYSAIGNLYKANIRTMNNFWTMSNSMIYPRKHHNSQNLGKSSLRASVSERGNPKDLRAERSNHLPYENSVDSALDSANPLKSYESFAYRNESQNLQTRRIKRPNKRNYSRNVKDSSLRADSQNLRGNPPQNLNKSAESKPYYFFLTPFINHNLFFESGRYNLSGFDYGFLSAFSAKIAESDSLGAHFAFSYGSLNDKHDKDLSITSMNFMLGLNYKLDLIYDMFFKARGDVFYFLNALDSATLKNIKPNNLGFGASVSYGKDFDFKQGGILGIEAGLDYKALKSNKVSVDSQEYQQALYNLIYADLGLNYEKYFGGFGINLGGGFKANLAPNLAKVILLKPQNQIFALDNDKFLGYANLALSYVLNAKNFDMEFSLAYYGNFGDRIISNGGGFEWRVLF